MNTQPRPIKELLQVMLDNLDEFLSFGLCYLARRLWRRNLISGKEEEDIILNYIDLNGPEADDNGYCWPPFQIEPRRAWLKEQIEKL